MTGKRRSAPLKRRTRPPATATPSTATGSVCPDCGHHLSAWTGSTCTRLMLAPALRTAADSPVVYCGHDCSASVHGESAWDRVEGAFQGGVR